MSDKSGTEDLSRQSFLGESSQEAIERCVVGIAGLGGGGSHIAQQLAHLGFLNYVLFDADVIDASNLNRLVGGKSEDVEKDMAKVEIARRTILGIRPRASVSAIQDVWQNRVDALKQCDLMFGSVDGFDQRRQLEATTRRHLIPLIDIGMDVFRIDDDPPSVAGQVILSMPGEPCMTCLGFLNEETLSREAAGYGAAGPRPQVVWVNGLLASAAVGIAVDLVTNWSKSLRNCVYMSFRGNACTLTPHARLEFVPKNYCEHFPLEDSGDPSFHRA